MSETQLYDLSRPPVLILRYDPESASRLAGVLGGAGHRVAVCDSFRELGDRIRRSPPPPLVILTGGMRDAAGREFLSSVRGLPQRVPVLALLEPHDRNRGEELRRLGVDEVLEKPPDPAELLLVVRRLLEHGELGRVTRIVGRTPAIQEVLEKIVQYAPVSSTVLIEGESGTGKELIARAIHERSPRAQQPFVAVNCAALAESLLESELFGHERGAFTGAVAQRKGRFELADRGTLFLDEVGEMPSPTQVKLLRVLEERAFVRVGGMETVHVDVRLIAATNKVLREAVERGEFRRDLYYRLNVLHIDVPPLRERRDDIPLLVALFLTEFARENGRPSLSLTEEAMAILQNYDWPGNVRELRNQIERMAVLAQGRAIGPAEIPDHIYARAHPGRLLPVASSEDVGGAGSAAEREFLYRYLFELKRDVAEIKQLLEDASLRAPLPGEIPLGAAVATLEEIPATPPAGGSIGGGAADFPPAVAHPRGAGDGGAPSRDAQDVRAADVLRESAPLLPRNAASAPSPTPWTQERDGGRERSDGIGSRAELQPSHEGGSALGGEDGGTLRFRLGTSLEELEKEAIQLTLAGVNGNRRKAASLLRIGERTLYRKLKEYGLE